MIVTRRKKSNHGRCDAMYTNPAWFMENGTGSCLLGGPAGKVFICEETLWLQLWKGPTLVNTSVPFNEICDPTVTVPRPQSCCQAVWQIHRTDICSMKSDKQIKSAIKLWCFPERIYLPKSVSAWFFIPAVIFVQLWKKHTIVPFLPCLYLLQSVNSVVLTPLHGLRKLSLQRTVIPRSITGPFRSSHQGLLAEKLCKYGFQQTSGENEAASQKTWKIKCSTTSCHYILVEWSGCPDGPRRRAGGGTTEPSHISCGRHWESTLEFPNKPPKSNKSHKVFSETNIQTLDLQHFFF